MKKHLLLIMFVAFLAGCAKKDTENQPLQTTETYEDTLSDENVDFLASIIVPVPNARDVLDSEGQPLGRHSTTGGSTSTQPLANKVSTTGIDRKAFIIDILSEGLSLCAQKTTTNYPDEGINKPAQKGIAYALGSKNFLTRKFPTEGNELHRKYSVYGIDCSGLMVHLVGKAGISMPICRAANFNSVFSATIKDDRNFNNMRLCQLGQLTENQIKSGDIITWKGHIGIAYTNSNGEKCLINSFGKASPLTQADQDENLGRKGVTIISLTRALRQNWFGNNYTVSRFRAVGDITEGGLLFYLDETGKHGIVAAPTDQSTAMVWPGGSGLFTSGTSFDIGKGQLNTTLIVNKIGNTTPAYLCDQLTLNGYNDWYLPSRDELALVYSRLHVNGFGNFTADGYYSSSDNDESSIWGIGFGNNVGGLGFRAIKTLPTYPRNYYNGVRAVRSF